MYEDSFNQAFACLKSGSYKCLPHLKSSKLLSLASAPQRDDAPPVVVWIYHELSCTLLSTEHVSFTERTQVNTSPGPRIWTRGITHCNYCDEPGDGLRAALSYLVNPTADLRQLPGTLQHLITNSPRPTRTIPRHRNHGCRPVAQGTCRSPSTSG
jgi:hypothetical protein